MRASPSRPSTPKCIQLAAHDGRFQFSIERYYAENLHLKEDLLEKSQEAKRYRCRARALETDLEKLIRWMRDWEERLQTSFETKHFGPKFLEFVRQALRETKRARVAIRTLSATEETLKKKDRLIENRRGDSERCQMLEFELEKEKRKLSRATELPRAAQSRSASPKNKPRKMSVERKLVSEKEKWRKICQEQQTLLVHMKKDLQAVRAEKQAVVEELETLRKKDREQSEPWDRVCSALDDVKVAMREKERIEKEKDSELGRAKRDSAAAEEWAEKSRAELVATKEEASKLRTQFDLLESDLIMQGKRAESFESQCTKLSAELRAEKESVAALTQEMQRLEKQVADQKSALRQADATLAVRHAHLEGVTASTNEQYEKERKGRLQAIEEASRLQYQMKRLINRNDMLETALEVMPRRILRQQNKRSSWYRGLLKVYRQKIMDERNTHSEAAKQSAADLFAAHVQLVSMKENHTRQMASVCPSSARLPWSRDENLIISRNVSKTIYTPQADSRDMEPLHWADSRDTESVHQAESRETESVKEHRNTEEPESDLPDTGSVAPAAADVPDGKRGESREGPALDLPDTACAELASVCAILSKSLGEPESGTPKVECAEPGAVDVDTKLEGSSAVELPAAEVTDIKTQEDSTAALAHTAVMESVAVDESDTKPLEATVDVPEKVVADSVAVDVPDTKPEATVDVHQAGVAESVAVDVSDTNPPEEARLTPAAADLREAPCIEPTADAYDSGEYDEDWCVGTPENQDGVCLPEEQTVSVEDLGKPAEVDACTPVLGDASLPLDAKTEVALPRETALGRCASDISLGPETHRTQDDVDSAPPPAQAWGAASSARADARCGVDAAGPKHALGAVKPNEDAAFELASPEAEFLSHNKDGEPALSSDAVPPEGGSPHQKSEQLEPEIMCESPSRSSTKREVSSPDMIEETPAEAARQSPAAHSCSGEFPHDLPSGRAPQVQRTASSHSNSSYMHDVVNGIARELLWGEDVMVEFGDSSHPSLRPTPRVGPISNSKECDNSSVFSVPPLKLPGQQSALRDSLVVEDMDASGRHAARNAAPQKVESARSPAIKLDPNDDAYSERFDSASPNLSRGHSVGSGKVPFEASPSNKVPDAEETRLAADGDASRFPVETMEKAEVKMEGSHAHTPPESKTSASEVPTRRRSKGSITMSSASLVSIRASLGLDE